MKDDATVIKDLGNGFSLVYTGAFVDLADVRVIKTPKKTPAAKAKPATPGTSKK